MLSMPKYYDLSTGLTAQDNFKVLIEYLQIKYSD